MNNRTLGSQVFKVLIALFLFVCLFVFLLTCLLLLSLLMFPVHFPLQITFSRVNLTSGKIKCVTFCCVTQTKQACELSARNYRFEILQRIQKRHRRLTGENCFEVRIRQNHFISEGS